MTLVELLVLPRADAYARALAMERRRRSRSALAALGMIAASLSACAATPARAPLPTLPRVVDTDSLVGPSPPPVARPSEKLDLKAVEPGDCVEVGGFLVSDETLAGYISIESDRNRLRAETKALRALRAEEVPAWRSISAGYAAEAVKARAEADRQFKRLPFVWVSGLAVGAAVLLGGAWIAGKAGGR